MQTTVPTWLAVLVAAGVPLLSALIGVGGVLFSQWMTNSREADRRAHEERMKKQELEEAR